MKSPKNIFRRFGSWIKEKFCFIIPFAASFMLTLTLIALHLEKSHQIRLAKNEIINIQNGINEFGWDIAYNKLEFGYWLTSPILKVQDLSVYQTDGQIRFDLPTLQITSSPLNPNELVIHLPSVTRLEINNQSYDLSALNSIFSVLLKNEKINNIQAEIEDLNIKNIAKIQRLSITGGQTTSKLNLNGEDTVFENYINFLNISLDPSLPHPLSPKINRIHAKTDIVGKISGKATWRSSLENWLKSDGYISVEQLGVNWPPFSFLGKGEIHFDEQLLPNLKLETSSKGLLTLLKDLTNMDKLDKKGSFVADVLLSNKAFRLKDEDQELTVVTPISYRDKNLAIENVSIYKF